MADNKLLATNEIKIVGRLISADVKKGFDKSNRSYASVNATIQSEIGGKTNVFEVNFYSQEMTKDNKVSQLYTNYVKLPELIGKKVEVSGSLRENRYWSTSLGQIVSSQQLTGRFVKGIVETTADEATYKLGGFVVKTMVEKKNKAGEVYRYDLALGQSNYSGTSMNMYTLHVDPTQTEIVRGVQNYEAGMTVVLNGNLMFTQEQVTVTDENSGFGQPMVKTYTNSQKNFYITGGSNPITDETRYPQEQIMALVEAYKANDATLMGSAPQDAPVTQAAPVTKRQTSLI